MNRSLIDLAKRVNSHRLSRRDFMRQCAVWGVSSSAALQLLSSASAQEPQRGGHLKLGVNGGSATDSLDPTTFASAVPTTVGYMWGNRLVEVSPDGEAMPELAESFEGLDGAQRWVFTLKQGIDFHNGKTMTAADVIYSLNRHRGEDTTSGAQGYVESITDIKANGDYEIEITLSEPNADLPYIIADYHLLIQPEGETDSGIGTGPYIIEHADHGVRYMASRNPNYFRSDRAFVESVETLVINDVTARMASMQTGKVHAINRVDPKTFSLLDRARNVEVVNTPGRGHYLFVAHTDTNPFDNLDLRLALKYAIDREAMLKQVLRGFGSVGNDHPINSAYPLFEDAIEQYTYDPDKAAFHYKKSGHSGPVILRTSDGAFSGAVEAAVLYKEQAAAAGIEVEVRREPSDGYWSNVWNVQPFCASYWGGRPTQDLMFSVAYRSDATWNDTKWYREEFDDILAAARSELDNDKRRVLYTDAQQLLHDDGGAIIPMFNDFLDAISTSIKGYVPDPSGELMGNRLYEFVWFDS